jgi:hypothetical protein
MTLLQLALGALPGPFYLLFRLLIFHKPSKQLASHNRLTCEGAILIQTHVVAFSSPHRNPERESCGCCTTLNFSFEVSMNRSNLLQYENEKSASEMMSDPGKVSASCLALNPASERPFDVVLNCWVQASQLNKPEGLFLYSSHIHKPNLVPINSLNNPTFRFL